MRDALCEAYETHRGSFVAIWSIPLGSSNIRSSLHKTNQQYSILLHINIAMSNRRRKGSAMEAALALTVCAFDDLMMELGAIAAGLIARGSRACTVHRLPHPVSHQSALANVCSLREASALLPKRKRSQDGANSSLKALPSTSNASALLKDIWASTSGPHSDVRISAVYDYGVRELGVFSKRPLSVGSVVTGPMFVLVEVENDQEGLNMQMQFEERRSTWVGCGPARLVNVSRVLFDLTFSIAASPTSVGSIVRRCE